MTNISEQTRVVANLVKEVADLLKEGKLSRRDIAEKVGLAHTTVNRIAKELSLKSGIGILLDCCVRLAKGESDFTEVELDALDKLQAFVGVKEDEVAGEK